MNNLEQLKQSSDIESVLAKLLNDYSKEILNIPYNRINEEYAKQYIQKWLYTAKFTYKEQQIDLFKVSGDYVYAHCISSDFAMGAGIALEFTKRGVKAKLQSLYQPFWKGKGYNRLVPMKNHVIANLVTKEKYSDKPTYQTLKDSLISLKEDMDYHKYTKLAMPKIGCGLDGLEWSKVKEIIYEVFSDTNYEILVCYL